LIIAEQHQTANKPKTAAVAHVHNPPAYLLTASSLLAEFLPNAVKF